MVYTTNQPDIVECARKFYRDYPTIENNIPKEKNTYDGNIKNFAKVDNTLAGSQMSIGTSSNVAQTCLNMTFNSNDAAFDDYVCILSVVAQAAIDNAKRTFDINIEQEIKRIKKEMVEHVINEPRIVVYNEDGTPDKKCIYPKFWYQIKRKNDKRNGSKVFDKKKLSDKINLKIKSPMNYVSDITIDRKEHNTKVIPISEFLVMYPIQENKRKSKRVEELIEEYSLNLYDYETTNYNDLSSQRDESLLLRKDFDDLIQDIRRIYISKNTIALCSYLINRSFVITPGMKRNKTKLETKLDKNRSILMKVLYTVNRDAFLQCFKTKDQMVSK